MLITTTDFINNREILQTNKDFVSGIKGMFGTKLLTYAEEYKKSRENAITELKEQAEMLECNAIVNLKTYYNQFVNSGVIFITVMAYGNAVVINE